MSKVTLLQGDALEVLRTLPGKSVHACMTSPPFYGLRDYKVEGQIGLEESPEAYIARLVEVFREVHRVLRDDGTLWLNLGESFWGGKGKSGYELPDEAAERHGHGKTMQKAHNVPGEREMRPTDGKHVFYKPKDLMLMPARVALALLADGWFLRQDVIWFKRNQKPESVRDRPTTSHEHIFMLVKQRHYYYDGEAVKVEGAGTLPWGGKRNFKYNDERGHGRHGKGSMFSGGTKQEYIDKWYSGKVQRRSVWDVPTKPYKGAHFAPWPEALVEPMLLASTSERGCCPACGAPWKRVVDNGATTGWQASCTCNAGEPIPCTAIDIFVGSGSTGAVCVKHHRDFIGIDLSAEYINLARERIAKVQPLLLEVL